eukprot:359537-Chlamydomonas_euryale.AAC.5
MEVLLEMKMHRDGGPSGDEGAWKEAGRPQTLNLLTDEPDGDQMHRANMIDIKCSRRCAYGAPLGRSWR